VTSRLDRLWRGFGTAAFLTAIGIGGSIAALTAFPLIAAFTRSESKRKRRSRYLIHLMFRVYCRAIHVLHIARLEYADLHRLRTLRGHILIANHPSLLDVVMIIATVPNVQCVVKAALFRHPFFRLTVGGAGFIRNDLDSDVFLQECRVSLDAGDNLIIFPEGTRTAPGEPPRMQRGFANLAIHAQANLQLLIITCDPPVLYKGNPWWHVPERRSVFRLAAGDKVDITKYLMYPYRTLGARKLVAFVEGYYLEKLGYGSLRRAD